MSKPSKIVLCRDYGGRKRSTDEIVQRVQHLNMAGEFIFLSHLQQISVFHPEFAISQKYYLDVWEHCKFLFLQGKVKSNGSHENRNCTQDKLKTVQSANHEMSKEVLILLKRKRYSWRLFTKTTCIKVILCNHKIRQYSHKNKQERSSETTYFNVYTTITKLYRKQFHYHTKQQGRWRWECMQTLPEMDIARWAGRRLPRKLNRGLHCVVRVG